MSIATLPARSRRGCAWWSVALGMVSPAAALGVAIGTAQAQSSPSLELNPAEVRAKPAARIGGTPPAPCVQVDIAGHRAGQLDCAGRALQEAGRIAQHEARAGIATPVLAAGAPDVAVGVASLSGARLRMGNALGHSVYPQRPSRAAPAPRAGGRP